MPIILQGGIPRYENEKDPFVVIPCKVLRNGGPFSPQSSVCPWVLNQGPSHLMEGSVLSTETSLSFTDSDMARVIRVGRGTTVVSGSRPVAGRPVH